MKRGKKYVEAAKLVDRATLYDVNEAVSIVKKASSAKFDETVEAHIRTGCDGPVSYTHLLLIGRGLDQKVRVGNGTTVHTLCQSWKISCLHENLTARQNVGNARS